MHKQLVPERGIRGITDFFSTCRFHTNHTSLKKRALVDGMCRTHRKIQSLLLAAATPRRPLFDILYCTCSTTRCLCAPFPFHTTASTMLPSLNLLAQEEGTRPAERNGMPLQTERKRQSPCQITADQAHQRRQKCNAPKSKNLSENHAQAGGVYLLLTMLADAYQQESSFCSINFVREEEHQKHAYVTKT